MTPQEFLDKYKPTEENRTCECAGSRICVVCDAIDVINQLLEENQRLNDLYRASDLAEMDAMLASDKEALAEIARYMNK